MVTSADILNAKILVVDDKEANVRLIESMLHVAGYASVESTTDPNEDPEDQPTTTQDIERRRRLRRPDRVVVRKHEHPDGLERQRDVVLRLLRQVRRDAPEQFFIPTRILPPLAQGCARCGSHRNCRPPPGTSCRTGG